MIGIYKITSPSGKIYIGSSIDIEKRITHYKSNDSKGQKRLYYSINKYGWSSHKFEVVEECSTDILYEREAYYGNLYKVLSKNGLNCVLPKSGDFKIGVTDCTREKMSASKMGIKNTFYGKKHSEEAKEKIRKSKIGKKLSIEHREKVSKNSAKHLSKIVLNLDYGIFYDSIKEAATLNGKVHSSLKSRLNGSLPNNTNLLLV